MSAVTDSSGNYRVKVSSGNKEVSIAPPQDYDVPAPQDVTLAPGESAVVNFKLRRKATISGAVVDDAGNPVEGVTVTVSDVV